MQFHDFFFQSKMSKTNNFIKKNNNLVLFFFLLKRLSTILIELDYSSMYVKKPKIKTYTTPISNTSLMIQKKQHSTCNFLKKRNLLMSLYFQYSGKVNGRYFLDLHLIIFFFHLYYCSLYNFFS